MDNFYVHLSSNTVDSTIKSNLIGNFVTKLSRKLNLTNEWEVALTEVSYTKSWYNIFEDQRITMVCNGCETSKSKILKAGNYTEPEVLFHKLNRILTEFKEEDFDFEKIQTSSAIIQPKIVIKQPNNKVKVILGSIQEKPEEIPTKTYKIIPPTIEHEKHTNKVKLTLGSIEDSNGKIYYFYPQFPELLQNILGLNFANKYSETVKSNIENHKKSGSVKVVFGELNLNAGIHSIYLYCDLIQPVLVGHREVQLLRNVEIPNNLRFGDQVDVKYQTPYYYSLLRDEFQLIEIDLKDDANRQIDFAFGRTSLTLHFRKIDKNVNESIYKLLH